MSVKVPLPDAKGAVRMKGSERLENGRCKVNLENGENIKKLCKIFHAETIFESSVNLKVVKIWSKSINFPLSPPGEFTVSDLAWGHRVQTLQVHPRLWKVLFSYELSI